MLKTTDLMKQHYRMGEASQMAGVSVSTLRRYAECGLVRAGSTAGGQRIITKDDLASFLKERGMLDDGLDGYGNNIMFDDSIVGDITIKGIIGKYASAIFREAAAVLKYYHMQAGNFEERPFDPALLREAHGHFKDLSRILKALTTLNTSDLLVLFKHVYGADSKEFRVLDAFYNFWDLFASGNMEECEIRCGDNCEGDVKLRSILLGDDYDFRHELFMEGECRKKET